MLPYQIAEAADEANTYPPYVKGERTMKPYRAEQSRIREQFLDDLIGEYAADLPASVGEKMFERAWAEGHASGYQQVENEFEDLADFARFVRSAK